MTSPSKGVTPTTTPSIVDPASVLTNALGDASPDLMRTLLQTMINTLHSAEVDAICGAECGKPSVERVNSRNGYRTRKLDTRVGTVDVAIPKLRSGTYFPEWLLERRKRSEAAMINVVADAYLAGVSTRRMDKLVKTLGIRSLSKSQVSRMAADMDEHVREFRTRPLSEAGPFTFVACDALTIKLQVGGRVINTVVLVETEVNADGHREVLGMQVTTAETTMAWNTLRRRCPPGARISGSSSDPESYEPAAREHRLGVSWAKPNPLIRKKAAGNQGRFNKSTSSGGRGLSQRVAPRRRPLIWIAPLW